MTVRNNNLGPVQLVGRAATFARPAHLPLSRRLRRLLGFETVLCTVGMSLQLVYLATGDRVLPAVGLSLLVAGAAAAAMTLGTARRSF